MHGHFIFYKSKFTATTFDLCRYHLRPLLWIGRVRDKARVEMDMMVATLLLLLLPVVPGTPITVYHLNKVSLYRTLQPVYCSTSQLNTYKMLNE